MKTITRLLLTCTVLFSCTKEMGPDVLPAPAVQEVKTYTLTVQAGKDETRALSLDESGALRATWAEGEEVKVYKTSNGDFLGTLTAQSSGQSTVLSGTVTGAISVGTKLSLDFLSPDYTNQDGTLTGHSTSIDKVCDYATATVKVTSIDGSALTTESAIFSNRQTIVWFTLKHDDNPFQANEMSITVSGYTSPAPSSIAISVNPYPPTSELYVAIPCYYDNVFSLSMQVWSGPIFYNKNIASVTLNNGKYYHFTLAL